jgi:hypothetical protein
MKINTNENKEQILETISKFSSKINLQNVEEEYEKHFRGFGGKADIEKVYAFIFDILYENNLVNAVDWKWRIQDELSTIKNSVSNFNYEIKDLIETDDFEISCTLVVNNRNYELNKLNVYEFFDEINDVLDTINSDKRILIVEGNTGDTLFYSVVEKNKYYDLSDSEYLPFVCS